MENGEWRMKNGECRMENGEWRMENGEWRMENGEGECRNGRRKIKKLNMENGCDLKADSESNKSQVVICMIIGSESAAIS